MHSRSFDNLLSIRNLFHVYPKSTSVRLITVPVNDRLFALANLVCLTWFVLSGFVHVAREGGDFATSIARRGRTGEMSAWKMMCFSYKELYYIVWLDIMIRAMLQDV